MAGQVIRQLYPRQLILRPYVVPRCHAFGMIQAAYRHINFVRILDLIRQCRSTLIAKAARYLFGRGEIRWFSLHKCHFKAPKRQPRNKSGSAGFAARRAMAMAQIVRSTQSAVTDRTTQTSSLENRNLAHACLLVAQCDRLLVSVSCCEVIPVK
jgi:hypothetical protein